MKILKSKTLLKIVLTLLLTVVTLLGILRVKHSFNSLAEVSPVVVDCSHGEQTAAIDSSMLASIVSNSIVRGQLPRDIAYRILDSTVKVALPQGGTGTGVIIWSRAASETEYYTYVITNHHVVTTNNDVTIEKFNYLNHQTIAETSSYPGKVVDRDASKDLALVEIRSPRPIGPVANFITIAGFRRTRLYDPVFVSGCSLGNPPAITNGNISSITTSRHLVTAFATFGNSGGGVFNLEGKILGIANQITGVRLDSKHQIPEPNLTRVIPAAVVCEWITSTDYDFIFGESSFKDFLEEQSADEKKRFY